MLLCNLDDTFDMLRGIGRNTFARLLGLDQIPWLERAKADQETHARLQALTKEADAKRQVQGTAPSHDLDAYAGTYLHPGYGTLTLSCQDGHLRGSLNDLDLHPRPLPLRRFRITGNLEAQFTQFTTAANGAIDTLAIHLDANATATVFIRHHRVNPAVTATVTATSPWTPRDFTIRPTSGEAVLARLPITDQCRPSSSPTET